MKKTLVFLLVLTCLFGLVGCDPRVNNLYKDDLLANTVKIEFVHYENENPEVIRINAKQKPQFDFNKITLIATLDATYFEDLLSDVAENDYFIYETALNEPLGKTLVLYQSNGNMIVLYGCVYTNEKNKTFYYGDCYIFDENGVFVEYIGRIGHLFADMIEETYFQN